VYNKAFARFYDNNDAHGQYGGKTLAGGMSEQKVPECCDEQNPCTCEPQFAKRPKHEFTRHTGLNDFDLIRMWANQRGIYEHGDTKTQSLKLVEEVGEICRAILKEDHDEVVDGIGDAVVVLTNLAELQGVSIEKCINVAYNTISQRSGKMVNGTFKKD
jgi:NTP pyrophosphatase (non-canonical NTP hydrolase)